MVKQVITAKDRVSKRFDGEMEVVAGALSASLVAFGAFTFVGALFLYNCLAVHRKMVTVNRRTRTAMTADTGAIR